MEQQVKSNEAVGIGNLLNTKVLMVCSAIFMGLIGIIASFLPQEIIGYYGATASDKAVIAIQIIGALYLGFAALNWMARGNIIGGIYSRPVALGNFFHFFLVSIILLKHIIAQTPEALFIGGAVIYIIFSLCFGYILFAGGKACA